MKNIILSLTLICTILLVPNNVSAQPNEMDNPDVPYRDSGEGYGENPGTSKKTSDEIFQDLMNIFFGSRPKDRSTGSPDSNPSTETTPIVTPGANEGATPSQPPTTNPGNKPQLADLGILGNTSLPHPSTTLTAVQKCLQNRALYEKASEITGVPWQVIAGFHYTESGDCNPNESSVSGRQLGTEEPDLKGECSSQKTGLGIPKVISGKACGFDNLLDSLVYSGNHLLTKNTIGQKDGIPRTYEELVLSVSNYNGGGNRNCRGGTPYKFCPPIVTGADDTYVNNRNVSEDGRYDVMYIRYCADSRTCEELGLPNPVHQVLGVLTVASALTQL